MKTIPTLAALVLLTAVSGCFFPVPFRDRHDGRDHSWRNRDDSHDRTDSRDDRDDHDDRDDDRNRNGRRCWNDNGRWVCR